MTVALSFRHYGKQGEPVIILHGLFGSAQNWNTIARRLAVTHRVYALDLRNHGRSPRAHAMSYQDLADDVRAFIEGHKLENVTLLGHSMGGKAAMVLALTHGPLVNSLIAVDIAPVAYAHSFMPFIEAMQGIDLKTVTRRSEVDQAVSKEVADARIRNFLLHNLIRTDGQFHWQINLPVVAVYMQELVGFPESLQGHAYTGKTLFLYGEASDYVRPEHRAIIHAMFPAAEIMGIPEAGHWVHAEQPDVFVDKVNAFMAS